MFERLFGECPHVAHRHTLHGYKQKRGYGTYAEHCGEFSFFVGVDFVYVYLAVVLFGYFVERGGEAAAWPAPCCVKVYQRGFVPFLFPLCGIVCIGSFLLEFA